MMMKPAGLLVGTSPGRDRLPRAPSITGRFLDGRWKRGRSSARAIPMFVSRSRSVGCSSAAATAARATEGGEPSSPKVTCVGQVRIRGKKSASYSSSSTPAVDGASKIKRSASSKRSERREAWLMRCQFLHKAWLCRLLRTGWKKPKGGSGDGGGGRIRQLRWRRWASFGVRSRRRGEGSGASGGGCWKRTPEPHRPPPQPKLVLVTGRVSNVDGHKEEERLNKTDDDESEPGAETTAFVQSGTTTPPKNALLLMRCRSAPHNRSSALATARVAVSPIPASGSPEAEPGEDVDGTAKVEVEEEEQKDMTKMRPSNVSLSSEAEIAAKATTDAAQESPAVEEEEEGEDEEEVEKVKCESQRPLELTRSKSEPAKSSTSAYCFWNGAGKRLSLGPLPE